MAKISILLILALGIVFVSVALAQDGGVTASYTCDGVCQFDVPDGACEVEATSGDSFMVFTDDEFTEEFIATLLAILPVINNHEALLPVMNVDTVLIVGLGETQVEFRACELPFQEPGVTAEPPQQPPALDIDDIDVHVPVMPPLRSFRY